MYLYSKNIYFPNQIKREGFLEIQNGKIMNFSKEIDSEDYEDYEEYLIIPGFIDQHIHGWGTGSFTHNRSVEGIKEMKKWLPFTGVTSFLPTSGPEPLEKLKEGINMAEEVMQNQGADGASVLGVHLEGPFVSTEKAGMMNKDYFLEPSVEKMKELVDAQNLSNTIKLMTVAPELSGAKELIQYSNQNDIQLNIGHSAATFEEISELKEYGLGGVTHMYSGMRGFHHRELGVAGTALYYDDLYCEFAKQTGWTVLPEAFDLAYRIKGPDKIIMTTDNTALSQVEYEKYHYIRQQQFIPDGDNLIIRNEDGSEEVINRRDYDNVKDIELSYIKSIQNLIRNVTPTIHDVIKMTSENSAKYLGVYDRKGSIEVGKDADLLVVDNDFNLHATYCMGKKYA